MKLSTVREPNNNKTHGIFKDSLFYIKYINSQENAEKIQRWMNQNAVDEVTIEENRILCLEPIRTHEKALFVDLWLDGKLSTERMKELLRMKQQYVQYWPEDFLEMVNNEQD